MIIAVALAVLSFAGLQSAESADTHPTPELLPMALEAGSWDVVVTFPASSPDAATTTVTGTQENTLRSNGAWLINEFQIDRAGYAGSGLWGWDEKTRRYVGVWGDTNEHRMRHDVGYWNPETRTMIWHTDQVRPDGMVTPMKMISTYDGDRRTFDIFSVGYKSGRETLLVHMDLTRRSESP